jgi:hydroxylamine reductase (hybrid-cluster protein)
MSENQRTIDPAAQQVHHDAGACGADANLIVARNVARAVVAGARATPA